MKGSDRGFRESIRCDFLIDLVEVEREADRLWYWFWRVLVRSGEGEIAFLRV